MAYGNSNNSRNSNRNTRRYASPEQELVTAARVTIFASDLGKSMDLSDILGDERNPMVDPSAGFTGLQTIRVLEAQQFTNIPDAYPDLVFTSVSAKLGMDDKGRASDTEIHDAILVPYINHPMPPRRKQGEKNWEHEKKLEELTEAARTRSQARQKALAEGDLLSSFTTIESFRVVPVLHTYMDGTFKKVMYVSVKWDVADAMEEQPGDVNNEEAMAGNFEDDVLA